eukprot:Awhi_evm1s7159
MIGMLDGLLDVEFRYFKVLGVPVKHLFVKKAPPSSKAIDVVGLDNESDQNGNNRNDSDDSDDDEDDDDFIVTCLEENFLKRKARKENRIRKRLKQRQQLQQQKKEAQDNKCDVMEIDLSTSNESLNPTPKQSSFTTHTKLKTEPAEHQPAQSSAPAFLSVPARSTAAHGSSDDDVAKEKITSHSTTTVLTGDVKKEKDGEDVVSLDEEPQQSQPQSQEVELDDIKFDIEDFPGSIYDTILRLQNVDDLGFSIYGRKEYQSLERLMAVSILFLNLTFLKENIPIMASNERVLISSYTFLASSV